MNLDYKKLIVDFCKESEYTQVRSKRYIKPCVYEKDLFDINPETLLTAAFELCGSSKNLHYLREMRLFLRNFFQWAVKKGFTAFNPFDTFELLSFDYMKIEFINRVNIKFIYFEDIDEICKMIEFVDTQHKALMKFIVSALYDGVKNTKCFVSIERDDIDLQNNTLKFYECNLNLADRTVKYLLEYVNEDNGGLFENRLIKCVKEGQTREKYESTVHAMIRNQFKALKKYLISKGIDYPVTAETISKSAFITFVRNNVESNEELCRLFKVNRGVRDSVRLSDIAYKFGYPRNQLVTPLRQGHEIFLMKSKWFTVI